MDADQVLAFRLARSGLAGRRARGLAEAAACPASDFARDAALMALAARAEGLSRASYERAVDAGELVVAHVVRGAIHALAPGDLALYGRALIARDDGELAAQLGRQVQRLAAETGFAPGEALEEVAAATQDALANGRALDRNELHQELRTRVRADLMPWCRGCRSHHVAPMLWRYATVVAGVRLDSARRYTMGEPGPTPAASEAVRRFLGFYGPATPGDFARVGRARTAPCPPAVGRGRRATSPRCGSGTRTGWILSGDLAALESPPAARGHPPAPAGRPLPAEAQPAAARPGPRAARAAVPARGEPRSGVEGRPPERPVAGQVKGTDGGGHRREARPPPAPGPRGAGPARGRAARSRRGRARPRLVLHANRPVWRGWRSGIPPLSTHELMPWSGRARPPALAPAAIAVGVRAWSPAAPSHGALPQR